MLRKKTIGRHSEKAAICKLGSEASGETGPAATFISDFSLQSRAKITWRRPPGLWYFVVPHLLSFLGRQAPFPLTALGTAVPPCGTQTERHAASHPGASAILGPMLDASLPHLLILCKCLGCMAPQKTSLSPPGCRAPLRTLLPPPPPPMAGCTSVTAACFCAPRSLGGGLSFLHLCVPRAWHSTWHRSWDPACHKDQLNKCT